MLVIRREQMDVLNERLMQNYVRRLAATLIRRRPEKFPAGERDAIAFVERNIPVALDYGITAEYHVALFMAFLIAHGEDFASRPKYQWAVDILRDPEGTGNDRMQRLNAWLRALSVEQARRAKAAR